MKTIILAISLTILNFASFTTIAQSYTTSESKSCGACQGEVSIHSSIGDKCPHCGVTWGRKTTTRTTSHNSFNSYNNSYNFDNSYNYNYSTAMTNSKCNVRSYPSTSAEVLGKASAYQSFEVVGVDGNWVQVKVSLDDSYLGTINSFGWIHKSLVTLI